MLARVDDKGAFVVDGGRVEIRYKPTDGKAYRANPANLERSSGESLLPDDHCASAGAATSGKGGADAGPIPPDAWIAYTDGACSGNPGPAGVGLIILGPGGIRAEGSEYLGEATNNIAELTAVLRALEAVPETVPAYVIHTDSQYAIGVLTKQWKAKANVDLIDRIKRTLAKRERGRVRLVYVRGHAGDPMNERADELAREAVTSRRSRPAVLPQPS